MPLRARREYTELSHEMEEKKKMQAESAVKRGWRRVYAR